MLSIDDLHVFAYLAKGINIERGRYCTRCNNNTVNDEKQCYRWKRYFTWSVNKSCKNVNNLDSDNKLTWLMTNENVQILVQVSKMILKSGI